MWYEEWISGLVRILRKLMCLVFFLNLMNLVGFI